jgi:hypothetical protein
MHTTFHESFRALSLFISPEASGNHKRIGVHRARSSSVCTSLSRWPTLCPRWWHWVTTAAMRQQQRFPRAASRLKQLWTTSTPVAVHQRLSIAGIRALHQVWTCCRHGHRNHSRSSIDLMEVESAAASDGSRLIRNLWYHFSKSRNNRHQCKNRGGTRAPTCPSWLSCQITLVLGGAFHHASLHEAG